MSYLSELVDSATARVRETKAVTLEGALEQRIANLPEPQSFTAALSGPRIAVIGEIKRASPAAGDLNRSLDATRAALAYAEGGAAAVSVVTEPQWFKGSLGDLEDAAGAGLPVLRKDFIIDDYQLLEARAAGADAVLLIVKVLGERVGELIAAAGALGMEALVEIHDDAELDIAARAGASLIGVNHRNLETFEVDPARTAKLAPRVKSGDATLVALSGVSRRAEVVELEEAGADAVVVGEALVTAPDPAAKMRALLGRP